MFNFYSFFFKFSTIVLLFYDENNHLKDNQINYKYNSETTLLKSLFIAHLWLLPISFIAYFITMMVESCIVISIKKIMNLKYVPISKILILYGGFGTIFTAIFSLITTFISCGKRNDDIYDEYDYLCLVVDNNGDRYIENYKVYFTKYILKDLLFDLLLYSLLRGIFNGLYRLYLLKYVQNLSPVFKSFSYPLVFLSHKLILVFQVKSKEPMKFLNARFFLDFSSDVTAIIGFLIYLEIIELNFCNLNKNLRKYIISRGKIESHNIGDNIENESIVSEDNEVNEGEDIKELY